MMDIADKTPNELFDHAYFELKARWPEAEPYIKNDAVIAYCYACHVIVDRWPEAEPIILTDPETATYYACSVINERWIQLEPIIIDYPRYAEQYAEHVIKLVQDGTLAMDDHELTLFKLKFSEYL